MVCENMAIGCDQWRHVHAGPNKWVIPDDFSGPGLKRPDTAIARAEDQLLQTADRHAGRGAERRVVGGRIGSIDPAQLTGRFVEAHEAVSRYREAAPFWL